MSLNNQEIINIIKTFDVFYTEKVENILQENNILYLKSHSFSKLKYFTKGRVENNLTEIYHNFSKTHALNFNIKYYLKKKMEIKNKITIKIFGDICWEK